VNDAAPRDIRDRAGHFLVRLPARLVPVEEQDGDVPGYGRALPALVADLRRRAVAHKAKGLEWPQQAKRLTRACRRLRFSGTTDTGEEGRDANS